jgi:hypothetical protein
MIRTARALLVGLYLALPAAPALAQEGGSSEVEPLYGYFAAGLLSAGIIFLLCKSSRRPA